MGGSVVAVAGAFAPGGSFFGTAGFGTAGFAATDCGLAVAVGAGVCGFCDCLVTGRAALAAELGERGTTCVRYTGGAGCCDPASVPVRICAGLCMAMAESPNRAQMLQIVRKNRNIGVLRYLEILFDFTPPMIRTALRIVHALACR